MKAKKIYILMALLVINITQVHFQKYLIDYYFFELWLNENYISEMKTSEIGLQLIKKHEGLRLTAYKCPAGVLTIGYGHTKGVKMGDTITESEANELLIKDIEIAEEAVRSAVNANLEQSQFDALVSLAMNIGVTKFKSSTLVKYLNDGNMIAAANEFPKWRKGGGNVLAGLVNRRAEERELFIKG